MCPVLCLSRAQYLKSVSSCSRIGGVCIGGIAVGFEEEGKNNGLICPSEPVKMAGQLVSYGLPACGQTAPDWNLAYLELAGCHCEL